MSSTETRARLRREDDEEEAAFAAAFLNPYQLVRLASDTWGHPVVRGNEGARRHGKEAVRSRTAAASAEVMRDRLPADTTVDERRVEGARHDRKEAVR